MSTNSHIDFLAEARQPSAGRKIIGEGAPVTSLLVNADIDSGTVAGPLVADVEFKADAVALNRTCPGVSIAEDLGDAA